MVQLLQETATYKRNLQEASWKASVPRQRQRQYGQAHMAHSEPSYQGNPAPNSSEEGMFNKEEIEKLRNQVPYLPWHCQVSIQYLMLLVPSMNVSFWFLGYRLGCHRSEYLLCKLFHLI